MAKKPLKSQISLFASLEADVPPTPLLSPMEPSLISSTQKIGEIIERQNETSINESEEGSKSKISTSPKSNTTNSLDRVYKNLVDGLRKFFASRRFKKAVIGVSGGVDSCLTLKIAVDALGAENVTALFLPELGLTKQENIDHSKILCEFLGVKFYNQPINTYVSDFSILPWKPNERAKMNSKARIRMAIMYNFANTENALVLGTSNKSEILLGYGTKYGDFAADVEVIGDLLKTEVIKLADHVGLPLEIVNKTPSAELAANQTDEEEIGASYNDLDKVLGKLDWSPEQCVTHGMPLTLVQLVFRRVEENRHKTELPLVIKAH